MPIEIPDFITKQAVVRPDLLAETPDPLTDVTHAEWNALVALARAAATQLNENSGTPGLLFELATTGTADLSETTEVQGKRIAGAAGTFAGSVTPEGDIASPWNGDEKMLRLTTDALLGMGIRRVLCDELPTEGFIVDMGLGELDPDLDYTVMLLAIYEQRDGVDGRGLAIGMSPANGALNIVGFGDDGTDSPAINTGAVVVAGSDSWPSSLANFGRGYLRAIVEFRKVDASSPEQWTLRVRLHGTEGGVTHQVYSGAVYPSSGWSTPLDLAGASLTRIGLGAWASAGPEGGVMAASHLRVYELGTAVP